MCAEHRGGVKREGVVLSLKARAFPISCMHFYRELHTLDCSFLKLHRTK